MSHYKLLAVLVVVAAPWALGAQPADPEAPVQSQSGVGHVKVAPAAPDAPVISEGPIVVDTADVLAYLQRVPEEKRGSFRLSYDRMADVADAVFVARSLAHRAHAEGLDKDDTTKRLLRQAQDQILAEMYLTRIRTEVDKMNLDQRAREVYQLQKDKFRQPEFVQLEYILVGLNGRSRQAARERAEDVAAKARDGKEDFLQLAARYSDDPALRQNGGNLGMVKPEVLDELSRSVVAKLGKGAVSDPVEGDDGFRIFRVVDRSPGRALTFEEAKPAILEAERERIRKERTEALLREIRSSPTVVTNAGNLESLVIPIDPETERKLKELQEKAAQQKAAQARKAQEPKK